MSLEHWETYYRGGTLATCPTGPDGGYDRELREAWVGFFGTLADGARLLDVGTGNGAVAQIARDAARGLGRTWEIHATDLAQIDPVRHVADGATRFAGIAFHPGVATERLPFQTGHFDAVSGQYALEYSDTPRALAEIRRVLKPGGTAQFIIHHAGSRLVGAAQVSLRESNLVLNEAKVYRRLRQLAASTSADAARRIGTEVQAAAHSIRAALPQAQQAGGGRMLAFTLDAMRKLVEARATMRPDELGREIDRAEAELRAAVRRVRDLVEHACSDEDMARLEQEAKDAGFAITERTLQHHAGTNLVGWRLGIRAS